MTILQTVQDLSAMSSVFHSTIGPMHNFHQTLPEDCRCLHVTVIGCGSGLSLYFRGQEKNTSFVLPLFEGLQSVCTSGSGTPCPHGGQGV